LYKFRKHLRELGKDASFDTPCPYGIDGWMYSGETLDSFLFVSDDGSTKIDNYVEYFNRVYLNET